MTNAQSQKAKERCCGLWAESDFDDVLEGVKGIFHFKDINLLDAPVLFHL